jgi:hypothetical protein
MRRAASVAAIAILVMMTSMAALSGCAGSSDGAGESGNASPAPAELPGGSGDRTLPDFPPGKFTVQLGAFQSEDGAAAVASLAKSRFSREVYTILDEHDRLYKVMLGVFDTKDLARSFRDTIVRQFPQEYSDAWVSELSR